MERQRHKKRLKQRQTGIDRSTQREREGRGGGGVERKRGERQTD